ncbi:MAG TPA: substrate-binding domain-containing protein [Atribacteraceae bacterium]|nr:substrate-binding domain-containing protein [Atribacteraceae bacterium]
MRKTVTGIVVIAFVIMVFTGALFAAQDKPAAGMYFRLVTHGGDDPFWAVVQRGAFDAAAQLGAEVDIDLAGGDLALQLRRFEEAVALQPDGIALVINDDTAWDQPVADALAAGIPVIGMNNDDTQGSLGNVRLAYVGQNEIRAGYMVGRRLFEEAVALGRDLTDAHVAMSVEVPGAAYGVQRSAGVKQAMEAFGITSYEIIDAGGLEMTTVESRQTSYLLGRPDTDFLIGLGGITTDRITSSLKAAGFGPDEILAGGFDTTPSTLAGIREGFITATIDQQQYLQGYFAVYMLYLYNAFSLMPTIDTGGFLIDSVEMIERIEELSPLMVR